MTTRGIARVLFTAGVVVLVSACSLEAQDEIRPGGMGSRKAAPAVGEEGYDDQANMSGTLFATITNVAGGVSLQPSDGERSAASQGQPFRAGDSLITGPGGRVEVELAGTGFYGLVMEVNPGTMRVGGNSELRISGSLGQGRRPVIWNAALLRGACRASILESGGAFYRLAVGSTLSIIEVGEVAVDMIVVHDRTEEQSQVLLMEGTVEIEASGSAVTLRDGQRAAIVQGEIRPVQPLEQEVWDEWAASLARTGTRQEP